MTSNCQDSPGAKEASLKQILSLVKGASSKGLVPRNLIETVAGNMTKVVRSSFGAGAVPSDLRSIFDKMLPSVVAGAQRGSTATGNVPLMPSGSRGVGPFGSDASQTPLGPAGSGDFFDPSRPRPGSPAGGGAVPSRLGSVSDVATSAVSGIEVTSGEIADYMNGAYTGDNDEFAVGLWLKDRANPYLLLSQLAYAKRLHNGVVRQCARYYKQLIYGNPDHPVRLGQIIYGIVSQEAVSKLLVGGPTSRHLLGQAVNFSIIGVDNARVVEDIRTGAIEVEVGTYGQVNGIHASLPFTVNGVLVDHLLLWRDSGVPGYVGYEFGA